MSKEKRVIDAARMLVNWPHGIFTCDSEAPCGAEDKACSLVNDLQDAVQDLDGKPSKSKERDRDRLIGPCPFCWGIASVMDHSTEKSHQVSCPDCGCLGPIGNTEKEAIWLWNNGEQKEPAE